MSANKNISIIDIGSSKIVTLIASIDEEERINIIGVSSIEAKGIRKGQVIDIEEASKSITLSVESAERMSGTTIGTAYLSVGGAHILSQNSRGVVAISLPNGEINANDIFRVMEASKAVSLPTAREILHAIPRGFTVDTQDGIKDPIGMTGVRLEVDTHIVTGSSTATKNLIKCILDIGIEVEGLIFSGLASSSSVLTDTEKELGVVLVDIGGGTTDICIYIEGSLSYSSVIPVGAKNITNDLAIGLRVSLESAEKIKLALSKKQRELIVPKGGFSDTNKDKTKNEEIDLSDLQLPEGIKSVSKKTLIEGIIKPRLFEIFTLVGLEIQKSGFGGLTPAGIVLTGGGAETIGITESAKQRLALPVRIGMPEGVTGLIEEIKSPAFASSIGLIFYGLQSKENSEEKKESFSRFFKFSGKKIPSKLINLIKSFLP